MPRVRASRQTAQKGMSRSEWRILQFSAGSPEAGPVVAGALEALDRELSQKGRRAGVLRPTGPLARGGAVGARFLRRHVGRLGLLAVVGPLHLGVQAPAEHGGVRLVEVGVLVDPPVAGQDGDGGGAVGEVEPGLGCRRRACGRRGRSRVLEEHHLSPDPSAGGRAAGGGRAQGGDGVVGDARAGGVRVGPRTEHGREGLAEVGCRGRAASCRPGRPARRRGRRSRPAGRCRRRAGAPRGSRSARGAPPALERAPRWRRAGRGRAQGGDGVVGHAQRGEVG